MCLYEFFLMSRSSRELRERKFLIIATTCLRQLHPILVSSKGYSLDLLFTDIPDIVFQAPTEVLRKVDVKHPPETFKFSSSESEKRDSVPTLRVYDFNLANYDVVSAKLDLTNWNEVLSSDNCDVSIEKFYSRLNNIISENVPTLEVYM